MMRLVVRLAFAMTAALLLSSCWWVGPPFYKGDPADAGPVRPGPPEGLRHRNRTEPHIAPEAAMPEPVKPLFDAINDAVSALTEVVRSLRATAAKNRPAPRKASVKTRVKRAGREIKTGARKVQRDVKTTARRAWETLNAEGPKSS